MKISLTHRFADALPELALSVTAAATPSPEQLVVNEALAEELGLDVATLRGPDGTGLLTGTALPQGALAVAQVYAGHQFGGFSPRLGDGRAMLLGEIDTANGPVDLHLKGSGPTPLSRGGDGLAAVGPMLREYLVSEAMHALSIPTTRSLAVVATGASVRREEAVLRGAVLARVAASHLRVGTFAYARAADDLPLLVKLSKFAILRHHPAAADSANPPLALFEEVVAAQARLVAKWLAVGFVHGVMNTDNVTISGETIDYGPCAFLDAYDPASVFSSIDTEGRYAFGRQPLVAQWNLARFAESILPLIADDEADAVEAASAVLAGYVGVFNTAWLGELAAKLGVPADSPGIEALVTELHGHLEAAATDWTNFFRALSSAARGDGAPVLEAMSAVPTFSDWLERWLALGPDPDAMDAVNPVYIPRNHLLDEALSAAEAHDMAPFTALLERVTDPFRVVAGAERYAAPADSGFTATFQTYCGT